MHRYISVLVLSVFVFMSLCFLPVRSAHASDNHWLTGALIGLGAGVGAGIGIGYAVNKNKSGSSKAAGMALYGTTIGSFGFGVGGAIGYSIKKDESPPDPKPKTEGGTSSITPELWIDPAQGTYGLGASMNF